MSSKTIIQADIDEKIKAHAVAALQAQGLSLEDFTQKVLITALALEQVASENSLDAILKPSANEASAPSRSNLLEMTDLKILPGFGMWADRIDMDNPDEWVRNLRKPRFHDDI